MGDLEEVGPGFVAREAEPRAEPQLERVTRHVYGGQTTLFTEQSVAALVGQVTRHYGRRAVVLAAQLLEDGGVQVLLEVER